MPKASLLVPLRKTTQSSGLPADRPCPLSTDHIPPATKRLNFDADHSSVYSKVCHGLGRQSVSRPPSRRRLRFDIRPSIAEFWWAERHWDLWFGLSWRYNSSSASYSSLFVYHRRYIFLTIGSIVK